MFVKQSILFYLQNSINIIDLCKYLKVIDFCYQQFSTTIQKEKNMQNFSFRNKKSMIKQYVHKRNNLK